MAWTGNYDTLSLKDVRANGDLQVGLEKWMGENKQDGWALGL